jgi:hypothetical protein
MTSTTTETTSTLDGYFKKVYGKKPVDLIPNGVKLMKSVPFRDAEKTGDSFNFPVVLQYPQSVTYAAAADGAFALNAIVAGQSKNASVDGSQMLIRAAMDYETAKKATGGERSFVKGTRNIVEAMVSNAMNRLECQGFYGRSSIGTVSSMTDGSGSSVITITTASFAPHIWSGAVGARLALYNSTSGVAGHSSNALYITSVDIANKTINVTGNSTEITAAVAVGTSGSGVSIYFASAYGKEFYGVDKILTNATTLFGIDAATYPLWTGSSYSAASADLTLKKVEMAAAVGASKGGLDSDAELFISFATWANSITDQAALRSYDSSYSRKLVNGGDALEIWGINGKIDIIPSGFVKEGEGFLLPKGEIFRVGATDLTFELPGQSGQEDDRFFMALEGYAGFEIRAFSHQAICMKKPAQGVKITNIVNS